MTAAAALAAAAARCRRRPSSSFAAAALSTARTPAADTTDPVGREDGVLSVAAAPPGAAVPSSLSARSYRASRSPATTGTVVASSPPPGGGIDGGSGPSRTSPRHRGRINGGCGGGSSIVSSATATMTTMGSSSTQLVRQRQHQQSCSRTLASFARPTILTLQSQISGGGGGRRGAKKKVKKKRERTPFMPKKAAVKLTERARKFFKSLLENPPRPEIVGVALRYRQASSGEPRMVFAFDFVTSEDLMAAEKASAGLPGLQQRQHGYEPVSLEVLDDGTTPKPPAESWDDGLPKLYVDPSAFMKVLGATVDVDVETVTPILHDREGNLMDPNA